MPSKFNIRSLLLLLGVLPAPLFGQSSLLEKVDSYVSQGKLEAALHLLDTVNTWNSELLNTRGWIHFLMEDYDKALIDFHRAHIQDSSYLPALINLTYTYIQKKDIENGMRMATRLCLQHPEHPYGFFFRGLLFYEMEEWEHALLDFDKALALDSTFADAFFYRAEVLLSLHHYEEALTHYELLIQWDSTNFHLWNQHGLCWLNLDQPQKALSSFLTAYHLDPSQPIPPLNLAETYYLLNNRKEACAYLQIAIRNHLPFHPPTHLVTFCNGKIE